MRNNEQVRALMTFSLVVIKKVGSQFKILVSHLLFSVANILVALGCLLLVNTSVSANQGFSNVDHALPVLSSEGEVMKPSHSWYNAHSKHQSYMSTFSADGRLLALTSKSNPVELWDTVKRRPISTFTGGGVAQQETFVDISPNGRYIAINVAEHRVDVRNVKTKALMFSVPALSGAAGAFSPDGRWFVIAMNGKNLDLWSVNSKKRVASFLDGHAKKISVLGFSSDGKYLVSADVSGTFVVWNVNSKVMLYQFSEHKAPINSIQFSRKDNTFVSVDTSGVIKLWDAEEKIWLHDFATPSRLNNIRSAATFSADGETVAISLHQQDGRSYILLYDTLMGGSPLFVHENNDGKINNIAYRPDGKSLVVSLASKTIKIFDIPSRRYTDTFGGQILRANKAKVSPDGKLIATATADGYIQLWDAHKKTLKYSLRGRNRSVDNISFSPNGQFIIAGDDRGSITVWHRHNNNKVFSINAHKSGSAMGVMSADNRLLATASTKASIVKLWNVQSNQPMFKFMGHHGHITGLVFSPDGKYIATASKDGTVKLWDVVNRDLVQTFMGNRNTIGFSSVAFSHNGQYLAGGTDEGGAKRHVIEIWNIKNKQHIRTLSMHKTAITAINFSTDDKQLISGSKDGTIRIWNVNTGIPTHTFKPKKDVKRSRVSSVDFSKNGKSILTVADDGAAYLWDLNKKKKAFRLLGGPRGTWVSENLMKRTFVRGDDGSLNIKENNNSRPPAPLAPKGLASKDKLILTASRKRVAVSRKGGKFTITIKNMGTKPSFWLQARQLDSKKSPVTLLSDKLTRLDAGRRGVLNLQIIPHDLAKLQANKNVNLKMEVISKAGSHFPIVIPFEFLSSGRKGIKSRNN